MKSEMKDAPLFPKMVWLALGFSVASAVVLLILGISISRFAISGSLFVQIYIVLEVARIGICFGIFGVRWITRGYGMDRQSTVISLTFIIVAVLFLIRLIINLSTSSLDQVDGSNISLYFRNIGRYSMLLLMIVAAFLPGTVSIGRRERYSWLGATVAFIAVITAFDLLFADSLPLLFDNGSTPLAASFGFIAMIGFLIVTFIYGRLAALNRNRQYSWIATGMAMGIPTELAFILVSSPDSTFKLIGNLFGFSTFLFIFVALVYISMIRPYEQLRITKDELELEREELKTALEQLKESQDSLTEANSKLSLMNSITRHDITNQLQVIFGYTTLADQKVKEGDLRQYLNEIKLATNRVNDQVSFMRLYHDIGSKEPQWNDIQQIASKDAEMFAGKGLEIEVDLKGVSVYADQMVEKVFYNLIQNSVAHGERVKSIKMSSRKEGDEFVIVYEDDGIGIPKENKTLIFERGFGTGSGLGLYLAKEILGITWISIEEIGVPGKGVRFEIRVPRSGFRIG